MMTQYKQGGSALALAALLLASPVAAEAPSSTRDPVVQTGHSYSFAVGDLRITALSDGTVPQDLHALLTNADRRDVEELLHHAHRKNPVEASINAFLIEDGKRRILVDTGAGELIGPGYGGKLVSSLASVGVRPEQIDDILITHVHTDHSGGLTLGGKMIFANATVHVARADVDFFLDRRNSARTGYDIKYFDEAVRTLKPYVDAGRVKTFTGAAAILPGISATLHPGHTPGSAFFVASSRGQSITFIGDLVHVQPVQFPRPDITIIFDVDPGAAAKNRITQFGGFARDRTLIAAPHLPFPGVGNIRAEKGGFTWLPIEYVDRAAR